MNQLNPLKKRNILMAEKGAVPEWGLSLFVSIKGFFRGFQLLKIIRDSMAGLFFPHRCLNCNEFSDKIFCQNCRRQIESVPALNFPKKSLLAALVSFGCYRGILERQIKLFKFHGQQHLAGRLGQLLLECFRKTSPISDDCEKLIIPVPLHLKKEAERGFNQSLFLARELGKLLKAEVCLDLIRVKNTRPLYTLSRRSRLKELRNAFVVGNRAAIEGRVVILVDDIFTTGATLYSCARALKQSGARHIIGLTLARV
jgi:ComF family protein